MQELIILLCRFHHLINFNIFATYTESIKEKLSECLCKIKQKKGNSNSIFWRIVEIYKTA